MNVNYKHLYRSINNRMIAGVCAGLGEYTSVDPTVLRLIAILLVFLAGPATIVAYLILALLIPQAPAPAN